MFGADRRRLRNLYITAILIAFGVLLGLADRIGTAKISCSSPCGRHPVRPLGLALIEIYSGGTSRRSLLGWPQVRRPLPFLLAVRRVRLRPVKDQEVPACCPPPGAATREPSLLAIIVATLVSFALGYMVIVWFMRLIETRTYLVFVVYRVIAGLVLLGLLMGGVIDPLAGT